MNELLESEQDTIKRLKAEVFRLRSIIDNIPGSIYWKAKDGTYLGRNIYATEKMHNDGFDYSIGQNDVIGFTDFDFFSPEIANRYRQHDLEVMQQDKVHTLEESTVTPNGDTIIQISLKRPFYNKRGEVSGVVGNTLDITPLKAVEQSLRQAKEKAEQTNRIKNEFIRNMEHDIRTPLSGIWGMANYLQEMELDESKQEYLNDISIAAKEILEYCNSISIFSKIESGAITLTDKKFKLKELVNKVMQIELPATTHKNLGFNLVYDNNIPNVIIGDTHRIQRVLINLISNSIKFTERGSITLTVQLINHAHHDALIRFIVKDTGIGIPLEKQDYIFEKFTKLSQSNQGIYNGIGLGLRIVKQFMHEMGGEIDLISEQGKGTEFMCTIPFKIPLTNDFVDK